MMGEICEIFIKPPDTGKIRLVQTKADGLRPPIGHGRGTHSMA